MSTLRTTTLKHGSSTIDNIVFDNQGRSTFGGNALFVNAQNQRVGVNTTSPAVALDVDGAINATGNVVFSGQLNLTGNLTVDTNTLFVDATNNRIGIGTSSPQNQLHINGSSPIIRLSDTGANGSAFSLIEDANGLFKIRNDAGNTGTGSGITFEVDASEKMRILADGNVGIGTNDPQNWPGKLAVIGDGIVTDHDFVSRVANSRPLGERGFRQLTDGVEKFSIYSENTSDVPINVNGGEALRIDANSRVLIGTTSSTSHASATSKVQVVGTTDAHMSLSRSTDNSSQATFTFSKSRGTPSSPTSVNNDDVIGSLRFAGHDGSDFNTRAAEITCTVDATPGANNVPGRLMFYTTSVGASTPTERMRITNRGSITIGSASTQADTFFTIRGTHTTSTGNAYTIRQFSDIPASVTNAVFGFHSSSNVVSGASINNYNHFTAVQGTVTGSTIASQYGFVCGNNLTAATNNYGFYSDIASGAGRWNFYANGTAENYFARNVRVGSTNGNPWGVSTDDPKVLIDEGRVSAVKHNASAFVVNRTGSDGSVFDIYNSAAFAGSISVAGTTTSYNTASDYRLKENIAPLTGAVDQLKALKPCVYNFKADPDTTLQGFIAHEAQEVCPQAVTGEKDGEEMQGIDKSKLVPLLTAALQEALERIKVLEQRVLE